MDKKKPFNLRSMKTGMIAALVAIGAGVPLTGALLLHGGSTTYAASLSVVDVSEDGGVTNGQLTFANDAPLSSFKKGETVQVLATPDNEEWTLGDVVLSTKGQGNSVPITRNDEGFSFVMPSDDVVGFGVFVPDDGYAHALKLNPSDFTSIEDYILHHANRAYVGEGSTLIGADYLTTSLTIADGSKLDNPSLDTLWGDNADASVNAFLAQHETTTMLYALNEDSEYFVGKIDTASSDNLELVEGLFGKADVSGTVYDDVIFDSETGLVYVPRAYAEAGINAEGEDVGIVTGSVRGQLFFVSNNDNARKTTTDILVDVAKKNVKGDVMGTGSAQASIFANSVKLQIANDTKAKKAVGIRSFDSVKVNGIEFIDSELLSYNASEGVLELQMAPTNIDTIEIEMSNSLFKKVPTASAINDVYNPTTIGGNFLNGTWQFSKMPEVGFTMILDSSNNYQQYGNQSSSYIDPALPAQWFTLGNYENRIAEEIAFWNGPGIAWETSRHAYESVGRSSIHRYATVRPQTQTKDGQTLRIPSTSNFNMYCSHLGVDADFNFYTDGLGNASKQTNVMMRILAVSGNTATIGLIAPSQSTQSGASVFQINWELGLGYLTATKTSANPTYTNNNPLFDMSGAEYTIYTDAAATNKANVIEGSNPFITDANGKMPTVGLAPGTYYIKETKAPAKGFELNTNIATVVVEAGETTHRILDGIYAEQPIRGTLSLTKTSANPAYTNGNPSFDMSGAEYTVYTDATFTTKATPITGSNPMITNVYGQMDPITLPEGTYYVRETKAPRAGFLLNNETITVTINANQLTDRVLDGIYAEQLVSGYLTATKTSAKPEYTDNNPAYNMSGAEYMVYTDAAATNPVKPLSGSLPLVSDASGKMNTIELAPGTYYIKETKAPAAGYELNTNIATATVAPGSTTNRVLDGIYAEQPMNDPIQIMIQKAISEMDAGGQPNGDIYDFSGAQFRIEYYTGFHMSAADAIASGAAKASAVWETGSDGYVRFASTDPVSGVWPYHDVFGLRTIPLGTIIITEVKGIPGTIVQPGVARIMHIKDSGDHVTPEIDVIDAWGGDSNDAAMAFDNVSKKGGLTITKVDADFNAGRPQGDATLEGVVYSLYNASKYPVRMMVNGVMTTTEVGGKIMDLTTKYDAASKSYIATTGEKVLPVGTYEVIETKASTGYDVAEWVETFSITEDGQMVAYDSATTWNANHVTRYGIAIEKADRDTQQGISLGGAKLEGAVFNVINRSQSAVVVDGKTYEPGSIVGRLAVQKEVAEDGSIAYIARSREDWLPYGTYEVVESDSGDGYIYDDISKAWSKTVALGHDGSGSTYALPPSTPKVDAYVLAARGFAFLSIEDGNAVENKVVRNDFHFQKKMLDGVGGNGVGAGIPFVITSKTTGEKHVIVTDENGAWGSAWNQHSRKTNSNDPDSPISNGSIGIDADGNYIVLDESKLDPYAGVWFTGMSNELVEWAMDGKSYSVNGVVINVNDNESAFPYDQYTMEELRVAINEDYYLLTEQVTLYRMGSDGLGGLDIDYGTINNRYEAQPEILTTLFYELDGKQTKVVPAVGNIDLIDRIFYVNLERGASYTVKGELHYVDKDGVDQGVIATAERTFSAQTSGEATIDVTFKDVDMSKFDGGTLVAFEYVYNAENKEVAKHEDIEDEAQTVIIPSIGTTLQGDAGHMANPDGATITLTDTVAFENLEIGKNYIVTGTLRIREVNEAGAFVDGGAILDRNGVEVVATATLTPSETSGEVEVVFNFIADDLAGKTIVAFESVALDGVVFAEHADIADEAQTVYFPSLGTTASDAKDGDKELAMADKQQIQDVVDFTNLIVGEEYTVVGTLRIKSYDASGNVIDGGAYKDSKGNVVSVSKTFTATKSDESVILTFDIDASTLGGYDVVVYETLYYNDIELGVHADINDANQTVHVPMIGTTLLDGATGLHTIDGNKGTFTLVDTVRYQNLQVGKEYTVEGVLHIRNVDSKGNIKDGGIFQDANGNDVVARTTFTPTTKDGSVAVTFTFEATDLSGHSVVAFETLNNAEGEIVTTHEDIEDVTQTVHFTSIKTVALSDKTQTHMLELTTGNITVVDTVLYAGLIPGETYTVIGTLHVQDKDSDGNIIDGGVYLDAEGKEVQAYTSFRAESADGSVDVTFTFKPGESLIGKTLVAFESLQYNGTEVTNHNDITDAEQSVYTMKIGTLATSIDGKKNVAAGKHTQIVDTIMYENLEVGHTYTIIGTMMVKYEDGTTAVASDANGDDAIVEMTFTPETTSGSVDVTFNVDTSQHDGLSLVAFERISSENGVLLGTHEDINDADQTVAIDKDIPQIDVEFDSGITNDTNLFTLGAIVIALMLLVGAAYVIVRKRFA